MLYCVIVLYNRIIEQSQAAASLARARVTLTAEQNDAVRVVYVDNSDDETIVTQNRDICAERGENIVSMHGNQGLPAAYMAGVSFAREHGANYVLISDEDSTYDADYLQNLYAQMQEYPDALFYLPQVVTAENGTIMSPFERGGVRFYINSGMVADLHVFESVSYDTGLFLDYVDNDFWQSCYAAGMGNRLRYAPAMRIVQDFSGSQRRGIDVDERRYAGFVRDGRYYYRKWNGRNAGLDMWIRCLHLCVMYRSLRFLRIMMSLDE